MWQYQGEIFKNILPGISGDMRVDKSNDIYVFDPGAPASLTFKPIEPRTAEDVAQFTEEWMNDVGETMNRSTVRLFRTGIKSDPTLLFSEYGQMGYWWISEDLKTIYILVEWVDYKKDKPELPYLSFWTSTDGGAEFKKVAWSEPKLGRGKVEGMYFDKKGVNGYILGNENTLLQTSDAGVTWHKVSLPYTETRPLPDIDRPIDTATLDAEGNLLFAQFTAGDTFIYKIPANNKESQLSQLNALYQLPNKRLLSMNAVPDKEGLYLFYIPCEGKSCTWYTDFEERQGHKNQPLHFTYFSNGQYLHDQSLGFFLPVNNVFIDEHGKMAATFKMPNLEYYRLLLSQHYGANLDVKDLTHGYLNLPNTEFIDLKNNQYWQYRSFNRFYLAQDIFTR